MGFNAFILENEYTKVKGLGDRLALMKDNLDWDKFRPIVASVYKDDKITGGRPHTDEVLIVRSMLLQSWYGLSDPELEFQCNDRLSFRNFLGFSKKVPDFSTIWNARERLQEAKKDKEIWDELQRQLDAKGYQVEEGHIQDATFVEADLGKKRHYYDKKAKGMGGEIIKDEKHKAHADKDGSFSVKNNQVHYGYKLHSKVDMKYFFIRAYEMTTASIHDGDVDLSKENEIMYRDRGYTGIATKAKGNASMKKGKLDHKQQLRNKRISTKRAPGERPFGVIKEVFNNTKTRVKTLERVSIKEMFNCFAYNVYNIISMIRRKLAIAF